MNALLKELETVNILWEKAIQKGNKKLMSFYCEKSSSLKKQLYPVTLQILTRSDFNGNQTNEKYLEVNFSAANNGWYDSKIFHKVVNGRYTPNEIGEIVNVKLSKSGGSAFLEFDMNSLELVKKEIEKHGYITKVVE